MTRVVVEVMLKSEISDPQGQAIQRALKRLGHHGVQGVRQGKRFELEVSDPVDESMIDQIADTLLANPVIEDFTVHVQTQPAPVDERSLLTPGRSQ